jgi:hypothetical protein
VTLINDRRIEFVTIARELDIVIINDVEFTAPCPACGMDTTWYQFRENTHVDSIVHCIVCEVRNG